jgi:hypothetical protein
MTTVQAEKIARRKLSLLQLAQELGSVSKACRIVGYSRQQFYEIRRNFQTYGAEGLLDRVSGPKHPHPNRVSAEIEEAILAYVHVVEPITDGPLQITPKMRAAFRGPLIANGGYDAETASVVLSRGDADLVSFGASFLANADLPERLRVGSVGARPCDGHSEHRADAPPAIPRLRSPHGFRAASVRRYTHGDSDTLPRDRVRARSPQPARTQPPPEQKRPSAEGRT